MRKYDIIGELRTYCTNNGLKFVWGKDEFYANFATHEEQNDSLILVVDLKPYPHTNGHVVGDIEYKGLFMIGRKFDANGISSTLDEKALQKYDRRLLELTEKLIEVAKSFSCENNLDLEFGQIDYLFNVYDLNADFVACQNIKFTQ